jgi:hypothetical protein
MLPVIEPGSGVEQSGSSASAFAGWRLDSLPFLVFIHFANPGCHAKIADPANAHFVHKDVFGFDVPVHQASNLMQIAQTPDDLPKHPPHVLLRQRW